MIFVCHVISQDHVIKGWRDFISREPSRWSNLLPDLIAIVILIVNGFSLSRYLERPLDDRVMWLYRHEVSKVSYHPAMFGGHRHCGSGNIMILVCQVISQYNVIKGSCDLIGRSPSRLVTILPSLVAIGTMVVEI